MREAISVLEYELFARKARDTELYNRLVQLNRALAYPEEFVGYLQRRIFTLYVLYTFTLGAAFAPLILLASLAPQSFEDYQRSDGIMPILVIFVVTGALSSFLILVWIKTFGFVWSRYLLSMKPLERSVLIHKLPVTEFGFRRWSLRLLSAQAEDRTYKLNRYKDGF